MPVWAQIMFFGALLSAILSTASGALLAPSATFSENILRPFVPKMADRQFLLVLRLVLVIFTTSALLFALNSRSTMYEMVQNAYNVTLTGAFVPLFAGAYWKRANTQGAICAVVFGIGTWLADTVRADAGAGESCGLLHRSSACCWVPGAADSGRPWHVISRPGVETAATALHHRDHQR
jgi:Na+/proline symporter